MKVHQNTLDALWYSLKPRLMATSKGTLTLYALGDHDLVRKLRVTCKCDIIVQKLLIKYWEQSCYRVTTTNRFTGNEHYYLRYEGTRWQALTPEQVERCNLQRFAVGRGSYDMWSVYICLQKLFRLPFQSRRVCQGEFVSERNGRNNITSHSIKIASKGYLYQLRQCASPRNRRNRRFCCEVPSIDNFVAKLKYSCCVCILSLSWWKVWLVYLLEVNWGAR